MHTHTHILAKASVLHRVCFNVSFLKKIKLFISYGNLMDTYALRRNTKLLKYHYYARTIRFTKNKCYRKNPLFERAFLKINCYGIMTLDYYYKCYKHIFPLTNIPGIASTVVALCIKRLANNKPAMVIYRVFTIKSVSVAYQRHQKLRNGEYLTEGRQIQDVYKICVVTTYRVILWPGINEALHINRGLVLLPHRTRWC